MPSNYLEETEVKHPQSKDVMTGFGTVEKQVQIFIKMINFTPRCLRFNNLPLSFALSFLHKVQALATWLESFFPSTIQYPYFLDLDLGEMIMSSEC